MAVLLFLRALAAARESLPGAAFVVGAPGAPGGVVAALVRTPHALHAVRTLIPSQRQSLARDWRLGYDALRRERDRLRALARVTRDTRRATGAASTIRIFRRAPELVLAALALAVLLVALVRRNS